MFTKTKMNSRLGYDSTARFIFDIFMFWTVMTGIACDSSNQNQSHELKIFNGKRSDNPEYLYQVGVPRSNNYAGHNGNALATVIFDKMLHWIFDEEIEKGDQNGEPRLFGLGHKIIGPRRRLQFALLPIMYKMGVMTTLLTALTVLALKGLTIGVILLIFAFGNHFVKYGKLWSQSSQPIHLHVHSLDKPGALAPISYHGYENEVTGSSSWDREDVEDQYLAKPYLEQNAWNSYRRRFLQNLAEMLKYNRLTPM